MCHARECLDAVERHALQSGLVLATVEQKVLYQLLVAFPSKFCVVSLVPRVDEEAGAIRNALRRLCDRGFVTREPVPSNLRGKREGEYFFFFNENQEKAAVEFLRSGFSAEAMAATE